MLTNRQKNLLWKYLCSVSLGDLMDIHGDSRWDLQDDIIERYNDDDKDDKEEMQELLEKAKKWKAKQRKKRCKRKT